ncbi:hypothetical protein [Oceanibium sediminis]|uniref:hypothetical protein n=1 Tax=Oceanibium sediminis TaxID=2026339 RepID=UPI000DD4811E|nr:hypothetical protein [Oceanibium sediminis]
MLPPVLTSLLVLLGLASGISALILRLAEDRHPNPRDIQSGQGLGHMLVGFFAGLGTVFSGFVGLFFTGIAIPVLVIGVLGVAGRFVKFQGRLVPFYRFKMILAALSLGISILLLINMVSSLQGVANV